MYIPKHFNETDNEAINNLIKENSLATIVTVTQSGLSANHIPLILIERGGQQFLQGHIALANEMNKEIEEGAEVLSVFTGVDAYISPNNYATKKIDHKVVPTWNYVSVHIKGSFSFIDDEQWKLDFLKQLTDINEAGQEHPWSVDDAPADYISKMIKGIVGIEIKVDDIQAKWKVSQNQKTDNKQSLHTALNDMNDDASKIMAALVKKHDN